MARRITPKTKIFQLRIDLRGMRPPVWRRVQVPGESSLTELHDVVQVALGWTDTHLHEFEVDGVTYGVPDPDWGFRRIHDEAKATLFRVAGEGSRLDYTYDFGDDWSHSLKVEKVFAPEPGTRYPRCVAGRRACPPEDVGGPWGYGEFLDALSDPGHEDHDRYLDWAGRAFDPAAFDLGETDEALGQLAWSRAGTRSTGPART